MNDFPYSKQNLESASTWTLLGLAICFEIAGTIGLRFSEGFTEPMPATFALVVFTLALYLVSKVMRHLPVSIAYPIWAGSGTVGVALVGVLALDESINTMKIIGILMIVVGVILINMTSEKKSGC